MVHIDDGQHVGKVGRALVGVLQVVRVFCSWCEGQRKTKQEAAQPHPKRRFPVVACSRFGQVKPDWVSSSQTAEIHRLRASTSRSQTLRRGETAAEQAMCGPWAITFHAGVCQRFLKNLAGAKSLDDRGAEKGLLLEVRVLQLRHLIWP